MNENEHNNFTKEILAGLKDHPKHLPSKYFYDEKGDKLFQQIMSMPEYYLTRTELSILKKHKKDILLDFKGNKNGFDLIELGAGDGLKTKILLHELLEQNLNFTYKPIDISLNALSGLKKSLQSEMKNLAVETIHGDYFESLKNIDSSGGRNKLVLFLGSNIGNLKLHESAHFLELLSESLNKDDSVLIGFDLMKSKDIIGPAYNDEHGITAAFNMNLLNRINNTSGANFNLHNFIHKPIYNEQTGLAESYIVSKVKQSVYISSIDEHVLFEEGEEIHTEISQKYNHEMIMAMIAKTNLNLKHIYKDDKNYYANYLFTK